MKQQIRDALRFPVGFPSLEEVLFPDDRIVLVPDAEQAARPDMLKEIVDVLLETGVRPGDLSILLTEAEEKTTAIELKKSLRHGVETTIHRPEQRDRLALLGVDGSDEPIVLCRELVDADMVLTIARFRNRTSQDYFGPHTAIFPRFSDKDTRLRFAAAKGTERRTLKSEVEEVARQLGVFFTIQFLYKQGRLVRIGAGLPDLVVRLMNDGGSA